MTILHRVAGSAAICVALSVVGVGASGQQSGVKVHGHWTIDVYSRDGTRVSHTEFDNALVASGGTTLSTLLSRGYVPGAWGVELRPNLGAASPCVGTGGVDVSCSLVESGWSKIDFGVFKTLQLTSNAGGMTLAGNFTARSDRESQIGAVRTLLAVCGPTVSPAACAAGPQETAPRVTEHSLGTPIALTAGQIVQVTVEITFS